MRGGLRDKETSTISATSYSTVETVDDFLPTIDPKARHWSRIGIFAYPACSRRNIVIRSGMEKLEWWVYQTAKKVENTFIHFDRIHERDGHPDGQTAQTARRQRPRLCMASRGKNACRTVAEQSGSDVTCCIFMRFV